VHDAQRASSAAAEERSDEGTGKQRLPAVGCNAGLGGRLCMQRLCAPEQERSDDQSERRRNAQEHQVAERCIDKCGHGGTRSLADAKLIIEATASIETTVDLHEVSESGPEDDVGHHRRTYPECLSTT